MLQCDFSYMISPRMFKRFVLPELQATCRRLPRSFYHLDGVGQIPHLDALLSIPELGGVQWVPGDGKPDCGHWPELYQKIHAAGKKTQLIVGGFPAIEAVVAQVGSPRGIQHRVMAEPVENETAVRANLARFGIG
jgi:5-methyltetrahydrofolate--homocysteine methyltransferase